MSEHEQHGEGTITYFAGFREAAEQPAAVPLQSRPLDTGGDALPFIHLEDRRFEILAYRLKRAELDKSGHRVTLMQGVGERGRDVIVYDSAGRVVQIIQCKHYQTRLTAPDLRKELLKLALHHHLDASVLSSAGISYELWCSGGFTEPAASLIDGWPSGWTASELAADANEVIGSYEAFRGLEWDSIGEEVTDTFRRMVTPTSVTGIDITVRVRNCLPVYEAFFQGKVVMARDDVMEAVKAGMKDALRSTAQDEPHLVSSATQASAPAAHAQDELANSTLDEVKSLLSSGKLDVAIYQLDRLRRHSWDTLSPRSRFRWLTLRADAQLKEGNTAEAASLLLEARPLCPDDETGLANEVVAFELLGERDKAHSAAMAATTLKPFSSTIYACVVRTADDDEKAKTLFDQRPANLKDSPDVWVAMASRCTEPVRGEETARRATELAPRDPRAWDALGATLLRRELQKVAPESPARQGVLDPRHLEQAEECFTKVVELSVADARSARAFALIRRASVKSLLERDEEAREDIVRAREAAPDDPEVLLAVARMEGERGRYDESIHLLRQVVMRKQDEEASFFLALALWNRDSKGDRSEATQLFAEVGKQSRHYDEPASVLAVEGLIGQELFGEAREHLAQVRSRVDRSLAATLEARIAHVQGDEKEASRQATLAIAAIAPATSKSALQKLAKLLTSLGRMEDALNVWERLCIPGVVNDDALQLVECAGRLGRHERVLEICSQARANGVVDEFLIHWEVSLLDRYNPALAVDVLESFLQDNPRHQRARLHLVHLAFRLDRPDLAAAQLPHLPAVTDASAEEGAVVVKALSEVGQHEEALAYSYDLLRRHFTDPAAHRAFRDAVLEREIAEPFEPPSQAGPGVAVRLEENGQSEWFVIEDSAIAAERVENELPTDSQLRPKLVGKCVGDEVVLSDGPGLRRSAVVAELLPKRVFRIRDVWQKWQYRFPNHQEMWMMRVAKNEGSDQCDFTSLFEMLQANREKTEGAEAYYLEHPVPLTAFAAMLGRPTLCAQGHIAASSRLPLRCCLGNAEEYASAVAALKSASEVVVDATALTTLLMLERVDVLKALGKKVLVTHSTASAIREYVMMTRPSPRTSMSMSSTDSGPVIHRQTEEERERNTANAEAFLTVVLESVTVVGCEELAAVEPEKRKLYEDVIGASVLETTVLAAQPSRIAWSDDGVAAGLLQEPFAADRVWTQAVLLWLNEEGVLDADAYTQASARLLGWRYEFTSVNPKVLQTCGQLAGWDVRRWPLDQAIEYLALGTVKWADAAFLGAKLLADGFLETVLPEARSQLVVSVAEALGRRDNHEEVLRRFVGALRQAFGLNALGHDDCLRTISNWQREFARRVVRHSQ